MNAVRKSELAALFGCHVETITNHQKAGMPHTGKGASLRFDVPSCHKWIVENARQSVAKQIQGKQNAADPENTIESAKFRREIANAQLSEIEVAKALGELVSREEATQELQAWMRPLHKKLQSIPSAWSNYMVGLKSPVEAIEALKDRVNRLLDDLSTTEPEEYELEAIDDDEVEDE